MRIKKKLLLIIIASALISLCPKLANAYFYGGTEYSSGGRDCKGAGNYGGYFWCSGYLAWYYYEFSSDAQTKLSGTFTVPADPVRGSTYTDVNGNKKNFDMPSAKTATMSAECAKNSSGFYLSGFAMMDDTDSGGHTKVAMYNKAMSHWKQYKGLYLALKRSTSSSAYIDETIELSGAPLPTGISKISVVPYSTVENVWNTSAKVLASKQGESTDFNGYTYFCAGDKVKTENYYEGDVLLKVNRSDSKGTNFGNDGDWQTAAYSNQDGKQNTSATVTIDGTGAKTLYYKSYGHSWQSSASISSGFERYNSSNFKLSTKAGSESKVSSDPISGNPTTDTIGSHTFPSTYSSIVINPGDTVEICAYNDYYSHYKEGDWSSEKSVSTCITVKYNNAKYNLGSASQVVVRQNGTLIANAFEADGATKSAVTNNRIDFGNGTSTTGSIKNSFGQSNDITVTSGIKPGNIEVFALNKVTKVSKTPANAADVDVKLNGIGVANSLTTSNGCNGKTLGAMTTYMDCYNTGNSNLTIHPEEEKTFSSKTVVPAVINASGETSGGNVTTVASVKIKADPLYCPDFNNAQIGVNNAINYGRIEFGNGDSGNAAGNLANGGWEDTVIKYLAPRNTNLYLNYYACMGNQALLDSQGAGAMTEYAVNYNSGSAGDLLQNAYKNGASTMIDSTKTRGKNINAIEIGSNDAKRIENNYSSGRQRTRGFVINKNFVGHTTYNYFSWQNGVDDSGNYGQKQVSIELRVPYNYYFTDDSAPNTAQGAVAYVGESPVFDIKTRSNSRKNDAVTNITSQYVTEEFKTTKRVIKPIFIEAGVSAETIAKNSKVIVDGDASESASGVLQSRGIAISGEGEFDDGSSVKREIFHNKGELDSISKTATFGTIDDGHLGDKICIAVSVYPADSHNLIHSEVVENGSKINSKVIAESINGDQSAALNGPDYTTGAKTLITLSCVTIGKKPTMSVEGGSLVVNGGIVEGYSTKYGNNIFGSWAEYDIVAINGSNGIGSGASLAYGITNPQTTMNAGRTPADGLEDGKNRNPQSIGNNDSTDSYGSNDEASQISELSWKFASNIYSNFIAPDTLSDPRVEREVKINDSSYDADGFFSGKNEEDKIYILHSNQKITIDNNIENNTKRSIYIIYSEKGIDISNSVDRIDAFLITYNNTASSSYIPVIDTCLEADEGTSPGNQELLEKCNEKTLVINGAVAAEKINLDRTAGAGSFNDSEELNPDSLTQRAEIFNYDMRIVFWAQNTIESYRTTDTTYAKELSPRL